MDINYIISYFRFNKYDEGDFSILGTIRYRNILFAIYTSFYLFILLLWTIYFPKLGLLSIALFLMACLLVYIKHLFLYNRKVDKNLSPNLYNRDLPSNLRPAHVRMLLKDGIIDKISIAATLLDLIERGYIEISNSSNKNSIFDVNKDLVLIKTNKETVDLLKYEKFLIEWFFEICGDGTKVSNKKLKKALQNSKGEEFNRFKGFVVLSYPVNELYFEKNYTNKSKLIFISNLIKVIIAIFGIICLLGCPILSCICVFCIGDVFYNTSNYRLTDKGIKEIKSWKKLKKYLIEFSSIRENSIKEIEIWNYYLTYSVAFEINKVAKKQILDFFGTEFNLSTSFEADHHTYRYNFINKTSDKKNLNALDEEDSMAFKMVEEKYKEIESIIESEKKIYSFTQK